MSSYRNDISRLSVPVVMADIVAAVGKQFLVDELKRAESTKILLYPALCESSHKN